MAVSSSSMAQVTRKGVQQEAGLNDDAAFKRKYGIPPKGTPPKGGWPDSAYGFPVPPATHPQAQKYARAVLSRAHQSKKFAASDLAKQIKKAQAIVKKTNPDYKPSKSPTSMAKKESDRQLALGMNLREYVPSTPPGSWERVSGLIQKAAQASKLFGGPGDDDPEKNSADTVRSWDIFIYASYPAKNTVVIGNDKLGQMWEAQFSVKNGNVTFTNVKEVTLGFVEESARRKAITKKRRESWKPLREGLRFEGKLREADLEKGTARIVVLCAGPGNAADKHYYTPECLEEAVESKVFEGAQNYIDHPSKLEDEIIPERMVEKLGGWFCDVELSQCNNDKGITVACIEATFVVEPGNETVLNKLRAAQQYAKQFDGRPYIGFSINAAGVGAAAEIDGQQYNRVDRITEVISVDLVTRAGAGGKLLALKEAQKRKDDMKAGLKTNLVRSVKGALKEAGVGLSDEQDKALDKALGIEDGGALDNLLDQVTMGSGDSSDDAAPAQEDGLDGSEDADQDNDGDSDDAQDSDDSDDSDDSGDGNSDDDDIEGMDESALKAALKAARKKEREAKKKVAEAKRETAKAKREAQKARIASQGIVREREINRVIEKLNPPAAHRPRMVREMRQAAKLAEMETIAKEYATAYLGGVAVAGATAPTSAQPFKLDCLAD